MISGDAYIEQVEDAFWNATIEDDWVNFTAQSRLSNEIYDILKKIRKFITKGNSGPAIEIGFTIITNGIDLINHNDDSCGYLGTIMRLGLHEKQLLPYHRNEIIECYVHYIYKLMENSRGRDTYREICNYLRHICRYGAKNLAIETATELRTKYRRCRALIEELNKNSFD